MSNQNSPFGANIINTLSSSKFEEKTNKYVAVSTDDNPIYIGDFVKLTNDMAYTETNEEYPVCTKADPGEKLLGIVVGILQNNKNEIGDYTTVICVMSNSEFKHYTAEDFWDRVGTTI
jgi:hypothetical protein